MAKFTLASINSRRQKITPALAGLDLQPPAGDLHSPGQIFKLLPGFSHGSAPKPVPAPRIWDLGSPDLEDFRTAPKNRPLLLGPVGFLPPFAAARILIALLVVYTLGPLSSPNLASASQGGGCQQLAHAMLQHGVRSQPSHPTRTGSLATQGWARMKPTFTLSCFPSPKQGIPTHHTPSSPGQLGQPRLSPALGTSTPPPPAARPPQPRGSSSNDVDAFDSFLAFHTRVPQARCSRSIAQGVNRPARQGKALRGFLAPGSVWRRGSQAARAQHPGKMTCCPFAGEDVQDSTQGDRDGESPSSGRLPARWGSHACHSRGLLPVPGTLQLSSA